jgi:hypothetical protein
MRKKVLATEHDIKVKIKCLANRIYFSTKNHIPETGSTITEAQVSIELTTVIPDKKFWI